MGEIKTRQIVTVELKKLKLNPKNPRKNDEAVDTIAKSIEKYGFNVPLFCDTSLTVYCGNTRLKAARKLKMEAVPCIIADDLTPEEIREYALVDNKSAEIAEWDDELLKSELAELDLTDWGFADWMTGDGITQQDNTAVVEDEPPEIGEEAEPICKLGDIWQLGRHRLICGDSTDKETVERLMDGEKADMVLSDPPYGMKLDTDFTGAVGNLNNAHKTRGNKYNKVIGDNEDFKPELISTFFNNFDYCNEVFLFGADYFAELLPNKNDGSWLVWDKRKESQADAIGSEFELIWSKSKHKRRMLRFDWFGFLSSKDGKDARHRVHPTQKPVSLMCEIIKQWGKDRNNIVDLYGGSGTTLIACEQTERTCYMAELDPHYCDVIIKRWENLTGQTAVKLFNG